jgi:hypothetical protein
VLVHWPSSEILTVLFGVYQVFVAFASVADTCLRGHVGSELGYDFELLVRVEDSVAAIVDQDSDFIPLLLALKELCAQVRAKVNRTQIM